MNKISDLLNFLIKNAFYEEAEFLFKFANDQISEDEMETRFPKIWETYNKSKEPDGKAKPTLASWTKLISKMKNLGMSDEDIKGLEINSFEDLKKKLEEIYLKIEKEMPTRFPKIWNAYQNSENPPFVAWADLTANLINIPMTDDQINFLNINDFSDLRKEVETNKIDPKNVFLNNLKDKDEKIRESVTEELLPAIESAGLI